MIKTIVDSKGFHLATGNPVDNWWKDIEKVEGNQVIESMPPRRRKHVKWDGKEWVTDAFLKWKSDMRNSDGILSRQNEDLMDEIISIKPTAFKDAPDESTFCLQKNIDKKALRKTKPE